MFYVHEIVIRQSLFLGSIYSVMTVTKYLPIPVFSVRLAKSC